MDGLAECAALSVTTETAGAVYSLDGKFFRTSLVSSGASREVGSFAIGLSQGARLAALFHTHPTDKGVSIDASEVFSAADIATAKALGVVSYVGVIKTGAVIAYSPGKDKLATLPGVAHVAGLQVSAGHPAGSFVLP